MPVEGEALADVQTAHDFEADAVDQTQVSPIGDEQGLDSAFVIASRRPLESHGFEDLTHELAHGRNAEASLKHRACLEDHIVAGQHWQALFRRSLPVNDGIAVPVFILVKQGDEERRIDEDAHSDAAAANSSSCVCERSLRPE